MNYLQFMIADEYLIRAHNYIKKKDISHSKSLM